MEKGIFLEIRYALMFLVQSLNNEEGLNNKLEYINHLDSLIKSLYIVEENYIKLDSQVKQLIDEKAGQQKETEPTKKINKEPKKVEE